MHGSGMDILEIKEQLGHTDISTTEGYIDGQRSEKEAGDEQDAEPERGWVTSFLALLFFDYFYCAYSEQNE